MSGEQEKHPAEGGGPEAEAAARPAAKPFIERVVIWAWPKTIVFWPTCVCALLFGFLSLAHNPGKHVMAIRAVAQKQIADGVENKAEAQEAFRKIYESSKGISAERYKWLGIIFLMVFAFNLIAFSFDVRVKGLAVLIFLLIAVVCFLLFLSVKMDVAAFLRRIVDRINPYANATMYFTMGLVTLGILLVGMITTYLRRVVVTHNEVVIHTGLLEAQKRVSTQQLTFHKEITDLMEHWGLFFGFLSKRLGSGQLVFIHPQLEGPVVLDNVVGVESAADRLGEILGVMAVKDDDAV